MNKRIISLLYHEVSDRPNLTGFQRKGAKPYKHSIEDFKNHLKLITSVKWPVLTTLELESFKYKKAIILTFDDGGASALYISKLLDDYGIKGHFFIPTKFIGNKYFLNKKSIIDIHERGHIIGSHSHSHPDKLSNHSRKEIAKEWGKSKKILENIINDKIKCCSIPRGDTSDLVYDMASSSGFEYIFNSEPRSKLNQKNEYTIIGRFAIKKRHSTVRLKNILEFRNHGYLRMERKFKVFAKKILPPFYKDIYAYITENIAQKN